MAAHPSRAHGLATWINRREWLVGYLFASPWLLGFLIFSLVPILLSFYYSFCKYDVLRPPMFVGLDNYRYLFMESPRFLTAIANTLYYTAVRLPLMMVGSLALAMLLARPMPGIGLARTIYYMPSIVSGVALSIIWLWMFNPQFGLINRSLAIFGVPGPLWLESPNWSKEAIILMGIWSLGGGRMVVLIAGINAIPNQLYEAARVDGANRWQQLRHITLPQLSGPLFLLTIVEVITSFQVFTEAYLMTRGGPLNSSLFYNLELYFVAFQDYDMGLASAMAWILFAATMIVTFLLFAASRRLVYYESGKP